ncbi:MAG: hypothetical protein AAF721_35620 [Myxococcota bacterium]
MSRLRAWGWAAALATGLLLGCEPTSTTPPVTPAPDPAPASDPAMDAATSAWLTARGEAPTRPEAEARARTELTMRLLGDERWLSIYPVEIHGAQEDPIGVRDDGQGHVEVALGLSRARAAAVVSDLETTDLKIAGPSAWRDVLYSFLTARAAAHLCARRQALFESTCESTDTGESDTALAALAGAVEVALEFPGGVPVDADGNLLQSPGVYVLWNGVPTADVPIAFEGTGSPTQVTDAAGYVSFGLTAGAPLPGPVQARLDTVALLGPLAEAWQAPPLEVTTRRLAVSRWALVGSSKSSRASVDALRKGLAAGGFGPASPVERDHVQAIPGLSGDARRAALTTIVEQTRGAVDYIVVADVEAAFASRMGGNRVWFQASGRLELLETWSGRLVTAVEAKVRASGVGDAKAELAARSKLVTALLAALGEDSRVPWPTG